MNTAPLALITGASRGLGLALARSLALDGWHLVVDARGADALASAADHLRSVGAGSVTALPGDVVDADHRDALVAAAERHGHLDALVNNASVLGPSPQPRLADYPLEVLRSVYEVNVLAPLGLVQRAIPLLTASAGVVVNVTSDAAVKGYEGWGGYGSSKAALEQLTNVLAAEHPGLRVHRLDPGDLRTQLHQEAFPGEDISDRPEPEVAVPGLRRLLEGRVASGRHRAMDLDRVATAGVAS